MSAFLGPMSGAAISAVGSVLEVNDATQDKIAKAIVSGQLTSEQLGRLQALELAYQNEEKERGFRYAELEFNNVDSARVNNVTGGVQQQLFWLSIILLTFTLGCQGAVLFAGLPSDIPELIVGRVLGLMDAVALLVLGYWFGSSSSSRSKDSSIDMLLSKK